MLRYRNDDTHHYNKSDAILYVSKIDRHYLQEIGGLITSLRDVIPDEEISHIEIPESLLAYCQERNLNLADFVMDLEKKHGYEDVNAVFLNWEKIKSGMQE